MSATNVKPISADSHVIEPSGCYVDRIEKKYRDEAPRIEHVEGLGPAYVLRDIEKPVPLGRISAAGKDPRTFGNEVTMDELYEGGWDAKARITAQEEDGVAAEVLYASVGMVLCNHPDPGYKQACFQAYNLWLQEFCAGAPDRLFGMGQTAVRSISETVADLEKFKEMGFKGAMFPGEPSFEVPYHHTDFDPVWRTASELGLPIAFHVLVARSQDALTSLTDSNRDAGMIKAWATGMSLTFSIQNILAQFVWGRVFERHPRLNVISVEADAGWVAHFAHKMDCVYDRHRFSMGDTDMERMPSEYFLDNVYHTFQNDITACRSLDQVNPRRLMWASDYPHSDSTWPWSQDVIERTMAGLSEQQKRWLLRDNVVELHGLSA